MSESLLPKAIKAWQFLYSKGFIEGFGHISVRAQHSNEFLISRHSLGLKAGEDDFVTMDFHGKKLKGLGDAPGEFPIHLEVLAARPDVHCVIHYHGMYSTAFTTTHGISLRPIHLMGTLFHEGIPTYSDPKLVNNRERGASLAQALGQARAVLMCAHGATITGANVEEAVANAFLFEENAHRACLSATLGEPKWIEPDLATQAGRELMASGGPYRRIWSMVEALDFELASQV
jgi:ribulose-5-phosphate 4-epimerase/fuculose-1-phosphate aldolase